MLRLRIQNLLKKDPTCKTIPVLLKQALVSNLNKEDGLGCTTRSHLPITSNHSHQIFFCQRGVPLPYYCLRISAMYLRTKF